MTEGCTFVMADGRWCGLAAVDGIALCESHLMLRCRCGEQAIRTCPDCHEVMCLSCWRLRGPHRCPVSTWRDRRRQRVMDAIRAFSGRKGR